MNESDNSSALFSDAQPVDNTDTSVDGSQLDVFQPIPYSRVDTDDAVSLTDSSHVDTDE